MYSPLSQKLDCALTSNGWKNSKSFLRSSSQVIIFKFDLSKIFHFLKKKKSSPLTPEIL